MSKTRVVMGIIFCLGAMGAAFGLQTVTPAPTPRTGVSRSTPPKAASQTGIYQIGGILVDTTNNQPLSHARVAIAPITDRTDFTTMVTADDGRFLFRHLLPGKYTLTAQRRGYLTQSFNQHDQFSSSVVVGEGHEVGDLLFRLSPEAVISGTVTDEEGEAVLDAQVLLFKAGGNGESGVHIFSRTNTNDEGAYRFGRLVPGKYLVAVSAKPWYAQSAVARNNGIITSRADGSATATTVFGDSRSQDSQDNSPSPLDVAYPITFYPGALDAAAATEISLARGEQSVADINLQPVPALHFRVKVDETSGSPSYPSLEVRLFDTAVPVAVQSVAGNHGSVTLAGVAPGRYTLRLSDRNSNEMRIASEQEIDVAASGDLPASQIQPRVPVIATVQAESGVPLQGQLNVRLYNKKSGETFAERLNPKGEAEFSGGVPPGNYEISIGGSAGAFLSSVTSGQVKPVGRMLAIKGPGPVKIALSLAAGQSQITGSVQKDGKPFAGAMVLLVPADPGHNQVLFRRDQSDTDGTFTLANVVPGKYTLLALENGWDLEWTKPSVLKPFLPQGEAVEAKSSGKLDLKLNVQ